MAKVRKAVIPAAGFGTRFLPITKASPKKMLPVGGKPIIQRVVEELVGAGIEDIIIVTGYHKRSIEDHFDAPSSELTQMLKNKPEMLLKVEKIGKLANFAYVRQKGPYGNGTPLLTLNHLVGNEPFIYTWGDDFVEAAPVTRFAQMVECYEKYGATTLSCIRATRNQDYVKYGFASGKKLAEGVIEVEKIVEKPGKENAPSDLATVSGFLAAPEIFEYVDQAASGLQPGHEFYYNDVLKLMLLAGKKIIAREIENARFYDTGDKLDYLKAVVEFGIKHEDIGEEFSKWIGGLKV